MAINHRLLTRSAAVLLAALAITSFAGCQTPGKTWWGGTKKLTQPQSSEPPLVLDGAQKADLHMAVARSLEDEGKTAEAINMYHEIIRREKWRMKKRLTKTAYHRLALMHDKKSAYDESEKFYRSAIKADPSNADVVCDFGYSCYLRHQWVEAEEKLRAAIQMRAEFPRARNNLALLLARTGRHDEAYAEFVRAGCEPEQAQTNLAFALLIDRKLDAARDHFQRLLAVHPNSETAKSGLASIESISAKMSVQQCSFEAETIQRKAMETAAEIR